MNKNFLKADVHLQDIHITISARKNKAKIVIYTLELCTSAVPNYDGAMMS